MKRIQILNILFFIVSYSFAQSPDSIGNGTYNYSIPWPLNTSKMINTIHIDDAGRKWLGTNNGVISLHDTTWSVFNNVTNGSLPNNKVTCITSNGNRIIVGTANGYAIFNGTNWTTFTQANSLLPDSFINCIYAKNNQLWIGTNKGILRFNGSNWKVLNTQNSQLANDTINAIEKTSNGDFWIGTNDGLSKLSGNIWSNYNETTFGLDFDKVKFLTVDSNDSLWIGVSWLSYFYPKAYAPSIFKLRGNSFVNVGDIYTKYKSFPVNLRSLRKFSGGGIIVGFNSNASIYNTPGFILLDSEYIGYEYDGLGLFDEKDKEIWNIKYVNSNLTCIKLKELKLSYKTELLDTNNLSIGIMSFGQLFSEKKFEKVTEIPKGSKKSTLRYASIWIGAKDSNNMIYSTAKMYGLNGNDWYSGPIMDTQYNDVEYNKWENLWKVNKTEIDYHNSHWWLSNYTIPKSILDWPGNGDTSKGQAHLLAPFFDNNSNSVYEPAKGDYPIIKGDQAIYFIFNDKKNPDNPNVGPFLNFEIHGLAYEFDGSSNSLLNNTLFLSYKIYNRSNIKYDSLYVGMFTDFEIGNAYDDYIGSDSSLNLFYAYNGNAIDGNGNPDDFGKNPPVTGATTLNNPMSSLMFFWSSPMYYNSLPQKNIEFYNFLRAFWMDSTHLMYGGCGHPQYGSSNLPTNFFFNGNWTEESINSTPGNRYGLQSSGPFTLPKDSSLCYDIAYIYARDTSIATSINLLKHRTSQLQTFYNANLAHNCNDFFTGIKEVTIEKTEIIQIYPNPTNSKFTIQRSNTEKIEIEILDFTGKLLLKKQSENNLEEIDLSKFTSGLYLVRISTKQAQIVKKIIKE